jgi:WD40 repeat protein/tetratricopeptide (TPR) repeat protein
MPDDHVHYSQRERITSAPATIEAEPRKANDRASWMVYALLGLAVAAAGWGWWNASRARRAAEEQRRLVEQSEDEARLLRHRATDANTAANQSKRQIETKEKTWLRERDAIQKEVLEAKTAREDVRRQRDEQAQARKAAEDLAQAADEIRQEAVTRRQKAARHLVKLHVVEGTRRMESGDLSGSLLWFAEALRLAQAEKLPEETHRLRLAAILSRCPRPTRVWVHEKKINVARLSADGKRVLTGGSEGALVVWDVATGKRIGDPMLHGEAIRDAHFSADGKHALTLTTENGVQVWDLEMGKEAFPAIAFPAPVVSLAFSPDGRRFLTIAYKSAMDMTEAELRVWDAATGEPLSQQPIGSEISPRPATFSPDGKRVLTICQDQCARIWDIRTANQVGSSFTHASNVIHASFAPDGRRVLTASADGSARVWEVNTGKPLTPALKHGAALREASFRPDGRYVLTVGEDRGVRVWDTKTGDTLGQTLRHPDIVSHAAFNPDGRHVLTTCDDGVARLWDYSSGQEIVPALRHGGPIAYAAFTPEGETFLTLSGQVVRLWDLTAGESATPPVARVESGLVVFSNDGKLVLRANGTTAQVYEVAKNRPLGSALEHPNPVTAAAFSADGKRVLTLCHQPNGDQQEGYVRTWETAMGKAIGEPIVHPRAVLEVSFSNDGRRILTACQDQRARLWDAEKGSLVGQPMEHNKDLSRALFTPDGKHVLTVDVEGGLRLWDPASAEAEGGTWGQKKAVNHLAFSPDGRTLVTANDDGTARVWEADNGRLVSEMNARVPVVRAAFSADGKRVVTIGADRTVRTWDAANGKPLLMPLRHRAAVTLAEFSADGRWLVTVAADGLRVVDATTGEPMVPLLRLASVKPAIRGVTLGRDGRLVLALGVPGDPSGKWVRDLKADARPVADLLLLAEVIGGERFNDAADVVPFEGADLDKGWQAAKEKYGKDFAPAAERAAAWHRRGAEECEQRRLWLGAVKHLDRLIATGATADLHARRARANAGLERWEAARADYAKALASNPERWDLWAGRAEVEAGLSHWEQAAADYSKAIERKGDQPELWVGRGRVEAERGDWKKSAADLGKAIQLGNADAAVWQQHALALLAGGNETEFRRRCARLAQRFGTGDDEAAARRVAWTCVLAAGAVRDLQPLLKRAQRVVTANPESADDLRRLAALLYRSGQFEAALTRLRELTKLRGQELKTLDLLFLSMTLQRVGRGDEAKKWLGEAEQKAKATSSTPWHERAAYQVLHREAEALVKGEKP